jgi:hypothetical protein
LTHMHAWANTMIRESYVSYHHDLQIIRHNLLG